MKIEGLESCRYRVAVCVCVLGDLSLIFIYCSSSTMVFIPLARPRHYLGRGLQISGQFLRHQSAIGQLETDAVAEGFRRLRQEKSSTAFSKPVCRAGL